MNGSVAPVIRIIVGILLVSSTIFAQSTPLDTITIALKWKHQFQFAGYYAAIGQGYFAQENIWVELIEPEQNYSSMDAVRDGDAAYGVSDGAIIPAVAKGDPFVVVATIFQHSPLCIVSLTDKKIHRPRDLANVSNGKEAVQRFEERKDEIDLIILDMIMPVMGGREALGELRKINPTIPIVIASGFAKEDDISALKDQGVNGFLNKPFLKTELSEMVVKSIGS